VQLKAIMVGNSDGIGLATTKKLLSAGWDIQSLFERAILKLWIDTFS